MNVGNFGLSVVGYSDDNGYVYMNHGDQYSLSLSNNTNRHVNLYIKIDGISVGNFQLSPWQSATLERPIGVKKKFTFFKAESQQGYESGSNYVSRNDRGLVEVVFVPEVVRENFEKCSSFNFYGRNDSELCKGGLELTSRGLSAGVTGMTGYSNQEFGRAVSILEDKSLSVTITLRLVVSNYMERPTPLPGRMSNPVPSPV